jgi:hypothetical protein
MDSRRCSRVDSAFHAEIAANEAYNSNRQRQLAPSDVLPGLRQIQEMHRTTKENSMRKFWRLICTIVLGSTLASAQATSNSGGGQTSNPGTGQPGTGNVPGTGSGQGSGAEIPATAQSKNKSHKNSTHKHHKKSTKTKSGSSTGSTTPK